LIWKMTMTLRISIDLKSLRVFLLISLFLFTFCGQVSSAKADSTLIIDNVVYDYVFAKNLHISASLPQASEIKNISLIIGPDNQQTRQVPFTMSADNRIDVNYDLSMSGFAPFSRIYYWFEAEIKNGSINTSPSYWFDYVDNRFSWKNSESNLFTIYWVTGDAAYGQKLQQLARSGLEQATRLLPVVPETPVQIYVYPDDISLQTVLTMNSQDWVNGHAILSSNRILVVDKQPVEDLTDLERIIPHEIMHLLEFQVTGENYNNSPAWLLEGLSTQAELYPNPERERDLAISISEKTLKPLSELCSGLSQDPAQQGIDYAHSSAVVGFIQQNYGNQVFLRMLENASIGMGCESNIQSSLGISTQQLDNDWQNSLKPKNVFFSSIPIATILWIAIPVILVLAGSVILLRRRKISKTQREIE